MPSDRKPDGEVWWVYSPRDEAWAGLRIGHFGVMKRQDGSVMDTEGATPFFILGEVPHRGGIRIWENVSKREGWVKVRRIDVPTVPECLAAIGELELPDDHSQDGQIRRKPEPDFVWDSITPFDRRKATNAMIARIDNGKLYAGSPMYYYCKLCGEQMMLTETHLEQPPWFCDLCISEGTAFGRRQANPA